MKEIKGLSEAEKQRLLVDFNATHAEYPKDKTIHQLFEEQVKHTPDKKALVYKEQSFTYQELNAKANRLANLLKEKGVSPDTIVGILVGRSLEMIIGTLAILKAGGAYMPIDPGYPDDRIAYMLEDSGAKILLSQRQLKDKAIGFTGEWLDLDGTENYLGSDENPVTSTTAENLVYIIYTSGSTGKPKGVMIEHRALVNLCVWQNRYHNVTADDNTAEYSGFGFDASVWEIFPFLICGATLHIIYDELRLSPLQLNEYFEANNITIADLPTQFAEQFMEMTDNKSLTRLIIGGDKLKTYRPRAYKVINEYGPTEYTISATAFVIDQDYDNIPIGKPLANTRIYILDTYGNLQPIGVPGELCIAGDQLARGYLNRPDLTAEKFVDDPFVPGEKMYKTGDLARWLPDGNIEFIGRMDYQVKIRGFRIELGEIEQQIVHHEEVREAVVLDRSDASGEKYLCAYIVAAREISPKELREFLAANLPEYMIPPYIIQLTAMPLTTNGKIDRRALPEPDMKDTIASSYAPPRNELEEKMVELWQDVLSLGRVGIDDNFFALGGHSLKAGMLQAKLQKLLGIRLSLTEIFKNPTIREMSSILVCGESSQGVILTHGPDDEYYPASAAQNRMYIMSQMDNIGATYNISIVNKITGEIDKNLLEQSIQQLIAKHEPLRTSFRMVGDRPVQQVNPTVSFVLEYQEVPLEVKEDKAALDRLVASYIRSFDLSVAPLLRAALLKLDGGQYLFIIDVHHIVFDGVSLNIFMEELAVLYRGKKLSAPQYQYRDFAIWQKNFLESEAMKKQERYWLDVYANEIPVLNMPFDHARPASQSFAGDRVFFKIDGQLTRALKELAQKTDTTLFMVLLAVYNVMLAKYTNQEDIIVGAPVSGRTHAELDEIIGMFVGTTAIRNYPGAEKTFRSFLAEVKNTTLGAVENQDYQFDQLVSKLGIKRDLSRNPLFDVMFVLQNTGGTGFHTKDFTMDLYPLNNGVSQFDLTLEAEEMGEGIALILEYCTSLFQQATIERMAGHLLTIMNAVTANPDQKISSIVITSEAEKRQLLEAFNATALPIAQDKTIHQLFEEMVEKYPSKEALVYKDQCYTYQELNEKVNRLAHFLRSKGLGRDKIAALMIDRSANIIISSLAIMKAGGAYLPIDPTYPDDRIAYMLDDSQAVILLTQKHLAAKISSYQGEWLDVDDQALYAQSEDCSNPQAMNTPQDLVYIIYTSGSTGKPKGVMIEHQNLVNLCTWHNHYHNVTAADNAAAYSGFGFDASVWEMFPFITCGAALHIIPEEIRLMPEHLNEYFEANSITITNLPTQLCEQFIEMVDNKSLKTLVTGGDKLRSYKPQTYRLVNEYGPTEYTISATAFLVDKKYDNIPIGKPLANTCLYVLDSYNNLQPIGVPGELCIAGAQMARGYLNRPELTTEKFVANPYATGKETARLYKTGDLVRWLPEGNIEFLGRIDQQVKIRGYRIELGEIEQQILKHPAIKDAVVLDRADTVGMKYLCGYLVADGEFKIEEIKEFLAKELPDYMIPAHFIMLKTIPLTANGKIDKRALPEPEIKLGAGEEYEPPRNAVESRLAEVWQDVLGCKQVGIKDNFFTLGGDSIKAIQVISRLSQYQLKLEMKNLFQYPRIRDLSSYVVRSHRAIDRRPIKGEIPLTPIQKWFFASEFTDNHHWNQSALLYAKDGLEPELLGKALTKVVEHHDALRSVYSVAEGKTIQYNRGLEEGELFTLKVMEGYHLEDWRQAVEDEANTLQASMDLSTGPLVKALLLQHTTGAYLAMVIHHLVVDGVSWRIILEDLATAYEQAAKGEEIKLSPKTDSYQTWAGKIEEYAVSRGLLRELPYWQGIEKMDVMPLPVDYASKEPSTAGDGIVAEFTLSSEKTAQLLKEVNRAYNTEINDVLLAALGLAMKKWANIDRVAITLEGHGREDIIKEIDINRTVGWFTTTYPVVVETGEKQELGYLLKSVKESIRRIPNKGVGSDILRHITPESYKENLTYGLQPEIEFNYLGQFGSDEEDEGIFSIIDMEAGQDISSASRMDFRLIISGMVMDGQLSIAIEYSKQDYKAETITKLLNCYQGSLTAIIEHCANCRETEQTPTDLGDSSLSLAELTSIYAQYGRNIQNIYSLSPMQEGMLFLSLKNTDSSAYFEQAVYEVEGHIDIALFEQNFNDIIHRYDVLRTAFLHEGMVKPRQVVLTSRPAKIHYEDISNLDEATQGTYIERFQGKDRRKGFAIDKDSLIRLSVLKKRENFYTVVMSFHHIIMDGWCMGIINQELFGDYQLRLAGKPLLEKTVPPYRHYIEWLENQDQEEAGQYWKDYLLGCENPTLLPLARPSKETASYQPQDVYLEIDQAMTARLMEIARDNQVTLNIILQGVWGVLLHRYNNQDDVVFGAVVSGRTPAVPGVEEMVGLFINTIPVRVQCEKDLPFKEFLQKLQSEALASEAYSYLPLAHIQAETSLKDALINHLIAFENLPEVNEGDNADFTVREVGGFDQINYDFGLVIAPGKEIQIRFSYNGAVFTEKAVEDMRDQFMTVIDRVAANPAIMTHSIPILPIEQEKEILVDFNDTFLAAPANKTIHQLFEEIAATYPDKTALVYKDRFYTYAELNAKINKLARVLRTKGVGRDTIVAILVDRSAEIIIGSLAVMKAGGAYLPIDPGYPEDRIAYMLEDSQAILLLTQKGLAAKAIGYQGEWLDLDAEEVYQQSTDDTNLEPVSGAEDLIYIIYTSGSTGKPKGVMIEHSNLVNLCTWHNHFHNITANDNGAAYSGFGFDASVWEMFPFITCGATLHIIPEELRLSLLDLNEYFETNAITITNLPTQVCEEFMEIMDNKSLKTLVTGGDKLRSYRPQPYRLVNEYGPTEYTISATAFLVDKKYENIPIGKPLANTWLYVLDRHGNPQPIGVPGELCIAGAQMARGYLNRPELTAEKFVSNPLRVGPENSRLYKTGDLVRWLLGGDMEFLGRIDQQVKIRGYRIELGEIEQQILTYPGVKDTVVMDWSDASGSKYLCAYLVQEGNVVIDDLTTFMAKELPAYMVPSYFMVLAKIPLTANGKIDKKALPEPTGTAAGVEYIAPRNDTEEKLAAIWREVLAVDRVGIKDNFFNLGGHSLKLIALVGRIQQIFAVKLPLGDLFKLPTLQEQAERINGMHQRSEVKIKSSGEQKHYPLSSAQKRIYVAAQMEGIDTGYNIPFAGIIEGRLERELLEQAFTNMVARHGAFRTSFQVEGEEPVQVIHPKVDFALEYEEISLPAGVLTNEETDRIVNGFSQSFPLDCPSLMKAKLVKLSAERHLLLMSIHHIIFDGMSFDVFFNELESLYTGKTLTGLTLEYKDYAVWQSEMLTSDDMRQQESYWLNTLSGELPVLNLVPDYQRLAIRSFAGGTVKLAASVELTEALRKLTADSGATMYMVLLAAYNLLLAKYAGQEDIIIGIPTSGRTNMDMENMIGMFVSTLPIRSRPEGNKTFEDFLEEVKGNLLEALEHQDYPFDELVQKLALPRDASRNPLFDVMFTMENNAGTGDTFAGMAITNYPQKDRLALFDMTMEAFEGEEHIEFTLEYCIALFKPETMERMAKHFLLILEEIAAVPDKEIKAIHILSEEDREQVLVTFNDTKLAYQDNKTIHEMFTIAAAQYRDKPALVFKERMITYGELDRMTDGLAVLLREKGVTPDSIVGVMVNRSLEIVIGALGVMKAGGAYMPIDPAYPDDRITYMLADSGAVTLLTQPELAAKATGYEWVDLTDPALYAVPMEEALEHKNKASDLAYVIYTSGSTGKPKGVMIEHRNFLNLCAWQQQCDAITPLDNFALYISFGFDPSVHNIFASLLSGSTLHVIDDDIRFSPEQLNEYFEANNITVSCMPTQFCEQFMELTDNKSLRWLETGGEKLKNYHPRDYRVINCYGPTEYTVITTYFPVDKRYENIPIGKPLSNTWLYVLDKYGKPQPVGVPGELCIAGAQMARGYLNRPELTAERFLPNPFALGTENDRLYKTGDLVRWLPDGNIEFLGRIDQQVKIRGYRIELGEIEQQLQKYPKVKNVAVIDRSDAKGSKYLCAYLTGEGELSTSDMKDFLGKELPDYMVPSYFIQMKAIPITANGKVDRRLLPEPVGSKKTYVAAANEFEEKLAAVWQDVLGVPRVGVDDNFFELGGHSLRAMVLSARIQQKFNVKLPFADILKLPTVKEMAARIAGGTRSRHIEIMPVAEGDYYPVSSAQKRMYVLNQMEGVGTAYNVTCSLVLEGRLNHERLSKAFDELVNRHESLRTSFEIVNDEPVQVIHSHVKYKRSFRKAEEKDMEDIVKEFPREFDLAKAPLFRLELVEVAQDKHLFLLDVHHIVFDGISLGVFIEEMMELYHGRELLPTKLRYRDFAVWQNELLQSADIKGQEEYWLTQFKGELPVLNLPGDNPRPAIRSYEGDTMDFVIDKELASRLRKLAAATNTTLFMLFLATYNVLLHKYSGQEDIIIGSPASGRPHADLEEIVGMFVSTLPLRSYPESSKSFQAFLEEVRTISLGAVDNQDYPFERLVEKLCLKRDPSRSPLFDVMFSLDNKGTPPEEREITIQPYITEGKVSQFDLTLEVSETAEEIHYSLEYCNRLFSSETISRMGEHYHNILRAIADNPALTLADMEILSHEEKQRLLVDFNNTKASYPLHKTIHELFSEQASKHPDKLALVSKNRRLTYQELDQMTNKLARLLRSKGVGPDKIVAIMVGRSADIMIGAISIMKAGGAYLPIDPEYPPDRIQYMLEDSGAAILLSQKHLQPKVEHYQGEWLDLGDESLYAADYSTLDNCNKPNDLAYIIYTSGSTGKPKGVMIEHCNLVNLCTWQNQFHNINDADCGAAYSGFGFDASVWEMFPFLTCGATLHIISEEMRLSPLELNAYFEANKVTVTNLPTQFCEQFMELTNSKSLKTLVTGGDKLKSFRQQSYRLVNEYGPTEYTISATAFLVDKQYDNIPIGKPLANTWVYVLDKNGKLQPLGVPGELCISGVQMARGYLNQPELTAEKFIKNPYALVPQNARLYKTGDLVRWLPSGDLEFLGRIDQQVKIRGYRIELGEIEQQILKLPAVRDAVVLDLSDPQGMKYLSAYVVPMLEEDVLDFENLKQQLGKELPEYMIPSYFTQMKDIPLTANGKIDRRALPEPEISLERSGKYVAPSTSAEEKIVKVWREVLGIEEIGVNDNFFALGGHSIKAVTVVAKLQLNFEVSVNDLFEHQTIATLAKNIKGKQDNLKVRLAEIKEMEGEMGASLADDPIVAAHLAQRRKEYEDSIERYLEMDMSGRKNYRHILLTGGTGYLGIHVLKDLLDTRDCHVWLIIRGKSPEDARNRMLGKLRYYFGEQELARLLDLGRVTILNGELQAEKLGLSDELYNELADKVESIIHTAANVRHYGHYREFYDSNVKATLELLTLAKRSRRKDFNNVSTISVGAGDVPGADYMVFTEYETDVGQEHENYYLKTKLEAEKAVVAAREDGINAQIFRVGNIVFNSTTGLFQDNIDDNAFYAQFKAFINIGMVPEKMDEVEFSFVDYVAHSITLLFDREALVNETYHIYNPQLVKLSEALTDESLELRVERTTIGQFIDHLYQHYEKPGFKEHIANIMLHFGWMDKDAENEEEARGTEFFVWSDKTIAILKHLGFDWRELEPAKMTRMIKQALRERTNFLGDTALFAGLSDEELSAIAGQGLLRIYDDGSDLLWEGEENENLYLIMEGFTEISRLAVGGWHGTIGVLGPKEFLGEENIFGERSSSLTAEAIMGEVLVLSVPGSAINRIIEENPKIAMSFLRALNKKLRRTEKMMVSMG